MTGGFTALEVLSAKAHDQIAPPERHVPDLPEGFRSVLGRMLAKDRNHRYADAPTLVRDLEALVVGLPPVARRARGAWGEGQPLEPGAPGAPFVPDDPPTLANRLWLAAMIAFYALALVVLVVGAARKYL